MQKLFESPSIVELRLLADYLERNGVAVEILNEYQGGSPGVPHWGLSVWAELWVRRGGQFAQARELLARYREALAARQTENWICPRCAEANPGNFETCWHCGGASPAAD